MNFRRFVLLRDHSLIAVLLLSAGLWLCSGVLKAQEGSEAQTAEPSPSEQSTEAPASAVVKESEAATGETAQESPAPSEPESQAGKESTETKQESAKSAPTEEQPASQETSSEPKEAQVSANTEERLNTIESKLDKLVDTVSALVDRQAASQPKAAEPAPTESGEADSKTEAESRQEAEQKQPNVKMKAEWLETLPWRPLGPANMAGRVTDVEVHPQDASLWWIATGGGGILKTDNRGTTVEHQFDRENTVSIGAIGSDPQDKNVLWVGTGEINPRNSVSYGDGIYKSTDGGKTFSHLGLKETYQISRILVHPSNSDIVYVGAQGRLYGTNEERGVYKTVDGGKNWEKVFYLDERTGVIDMVMHPADPDTLIVAMWDRLRDGFDSWPGDVPKPDGIDGYDPIRKWGPKAGLYKTSDGGKNWTKLSQGLPSGMTGRIGLDWQKKSPHTIYAIIDCEDIGKGPEPFSCFLGIVGKDENGKAVVTQVMPDSPADKAGIQLGDTLLAADGKKLYKFDELLAVLREKDAGERIKLAVLRGEEEMELSPKLDVRPGSRTSAAEPYYGVVGEDQAGRIAFTEISQGGPAEQAGLKPGDIVLSVNGEAPKSYAAWIEATKELAIGDQVSLGIQRGEEQLDVVVTLGKKPGTGPRSSAFMGIQGEDQPGGGAKLTSITSDGPSDKAGLKANDIVIQVGDKKIESYQDLTNEIRAREAKQEMPVQIKRGDRTLELTVVLGDRDAGDSDRPYSYSYFGQYPNAQDQQGVDGHEYGGVYKSTDAGESWVRVNSLNVRPMYFSVIRVDPSDDQRVYVLGVSQFQSDNGGVTFTSDLGRGVHADAHDLWINPDDGRHMIIGCDGGFYVTYDRGNRWDHINTAAVGQFYHVAITPSKPYWVYGGLQDNGSWGGPAVGLSGGVLNEDWISVGGGDGFVCRVDPEDTDVVYSESQNGSIRRRNLRTGDGASIRPRPEDGQTFRFNWNTPFILSHHNSKVFYSAGNYVFRSLDRGDNLKTISPELTRTDRGSATALSESPMDPDVLYVGTDDGALWVTRDGGTSWKEITDNLGVDPMWVATVEASRYAPGRVYVCLDGHRSDDDRPYVFLSEDYGETFTELSKELPRGSSRCLREDVANEQVLYLGTEFAFWVSIDGGLSWAQFNQALPTVAVHEVAQHPEVEEIVLATHGRSLWACDVTALRKLQGAQLGEKIVLLEPEDVIRWRRALRRGGTNRAYSSENPSSQAKLWYSMPKDVEKVVLQIQNVAGEKLAELRGKKEAGLHRVDWNLIVESERGRRSFVPNGDYRVTLVVDDKPADTKILTVKQDPTLPPDALSELEYEAVNALLEVEEEESEGDDSIERQDD